MRGPFPLVPSQLNLRVPCGSRGVYCVGKTPGRVNRVGRADRDLNGELKTLEADYHFFWYETVLTPRETYREQCRAFHKYYGMGGLDSDEHPVPPARVEDRCPVCGKAPAELPGGVTAPTQSARSA